MAPQYQIFTDSGADLPDAVLHSNMVCVIPMSYLLNGESGEFDGGAPRDAFCESFYNALRQKSSTVSTSQITPFAFEQALRPVLEAGQDALYLGFSGGLSSTFQVAKSTAQRLMEQYPGRSVLCVDSIAAGPGLGIVLWEAVQNQKLGMSLERNAEALTDLAPKVCHWFVVDSLDFLKRGGRVSPAVAFVGDKLNLKPILDISLDGTLKVVSKARGLHAAMRYMVSSLDQDLPQENANVLIAHASSLENAKALAEQVRQAVPRAKVEITALSPIIGAHTGPGMLAVCYRSVKIHRS